MLTCLKHTQFHLLAVHMWLHPYTTSLITFKSYTRENVHAYLLLYMQLSEG
jgi:hypothetical protein